MFIKKFWAEKKLNSVKCIKTSKGISRASWNVTINNEQDIQK